MGALMRTGARVFTTLSMLAAGAAVPCVSARTFAAEPRNGPATVPVSLGVLPGVGYRIIVPYQAHKDCGDSSRDASKRVCTNGLPLFLDLRGAYGLGPALDLVLDLRVGMLRDTVTDARQVAVAPGLRWWIDRRPRLSLYTTLQGVLDATDHHGVVATVDLGARNSTGLLYDLVRNVGVYFQFGETVGDRRWFRFELDVGLGVQARWQ
jgi:hypothetical protein